MSKELISTSIACSLGNHYTVCFHSGVSFFHATDVTVMNGDGDCRGQCLRAFGNTM